MACKTVPKDIICLLENFFNHLNNKSKDILHISNLQCGFEKWLQLEFIVWAIKEYGLQPLNTRNNYRHGIGVEHYTEINSCNRNWKLIDIWLNPVKNKFYYIEFKSIVKDWNEEKQVTSWIDDFGILQRIDKSYMPYGIASVLFGSAKENWDISKWKRFVLKRSYKSFPVKPFFKALGQIGVAVLSKQY